MNFILCVDGSQWWSLSCIVTGRSIYPLGEAGSWKPGEYMGHTGGESGWGENGNSKKTVATGQTKENKILLRQQ